MGQKQRTMELQAIIGQLHIIDGVVQQGTPIPGLLASVPPPKSARGRELDTLFIHLSLSGPPAETIVLSQDLLDCITNHYYRTPGSVTAALRKAVLEVNQQLLQWNLSGAGPAREGALTCAALHGQELFIIQAGEALALIGRNFGVERLPAKMPDRPTPLGRTVGLDMRYFHNWLEIGDSLLLADPRLNDLAEDVLKPALVKSHVEESLPRLAQIIGRASGRLLLVEFSDEAPSDLPDNVVATPAGRVVTPRPVPAPLIQMPQSATRPAASQAAPPAPVHRSRQTASRPATAQAAMGLSRATGWLADLLARLRPPRRENDEPPNLLIPTLIALLVPLLVAIVVTGVYLQRGRMVRMNQIESEMQQSLGLAEQSGDEVQARNYYVHVLQLAAEAEMLRPGDEEVNQLRLQALAELDQIDQVTRLTPQLLYQYDNSSQLAGVLLRPGLNGDIFTLDRANNVVYLHHTDESYGVPAGQQPERIFFGSQAIGSHTVGNLLDFMWRSRASEVSLDNLAVLDSRGAIVSYLPNSVSNRAIPIGLATNDWQQPVAITQFNERLYVLDPQAKVIWRYFAEGDGFITDNNNRYLELPDLEQAVDIAIYSEDGSVIVLYGDGKLRRYANGTLLWGENELLANGLPSPLIAPTQVKIVGQGLRSSIFVADPGNGQIVELSLGGTFLNQFKVLDSGREQFAELRDFDIVREPTFRIFYVTTTTLFVAQQP